MIDHKMKKQLIICFISVSILFLCIISKLTGLTDSDVKCFAVDSNDRIYVGKSEKILVYDNGIAVNCLNPQTSRGYMFTITEDDHILLSTANTVYSMDLEGNILDTWKDSASSVYTEIQFNKNCFESKNSDVYSLKYRLGWTRILKNNCEVVYKITTLSFVVKIILELAVAVFLGSTLSVVRRYNQVSR